MGGSRHSHEQPGLPRIRSISTSEHPKVSYSVEKDDKLSPSTPESLRELSIYGRLRASVSPFLVEDDTAESGP